jgi:hypothetical protein
LLFDPERKAFTLEKLDQAFVFNAEVYAKLHPAVSLGTGDKAGGDGEIGGDGGDAGEGGEDSVYDWRKFVGRKKKSAAEEKQAKRLEALKRAGRDVVEVPEEKREEVGGGEQEVYIPDARGGEAEVEVEDMDMDAPGESEDDVEEDVEMVAAPPPPPPPPVQVQRKEKEKKEVRKDKPQQRKVQPPVGEDELVLPDPTPPPQQDSDEEEIDFSDEDEPAPPPPPPQQQQVAQTMPTPQTMEEEEEEVDDLEIDLGKELEEALESGDDGGLVIEGGDLEVGGMGVVGGAPKSLRELYGGVEDEDSESEEE